MLHAVLLGETDITSTQVFFGLTVSAHNSMPWLERGGRPHPGRPDSLILDAPLWHHWPQVLIWVPFQASIFYVLAAWTQSEPLVQSYLKGIATQQVFRRACLRGSDVMCWVIPWPAGTQSISSWELAMKGMLAACEWKAFKTCCTSTCTCQTGESDNASVLCSRDSIPLIMKGAGGEGTARLDGGVLKWCTSCSAANSQKRGCLDGVDRPCQPPWQVKTITYVWGACCLAYLVLYIAYNCTANHRFSKLPYGRYRTGHALYAWQVRRRSL